MTQGGFRLEYYPSGADTLTLQGDFYSGREGVPTSTTVDGQNVLFRWTRVFSATADLHLQIYVDRTWRRVEASFGDDLKTYDVDFQHRFPIGVRHSILWGLGYRLMQDDAALAFSPAYREMQLFSGFVQDEITLIPDRLQLTLGTKLEHNDFSGVEVQPSVRLAWTPTDRQTIWAAVSRAVRSPSRLDTDIVIPNLVGDDNFASEKVLAYELGYRVRPVATFSLSLAAFYNQYEDIRSINLHATPPPIAVLANGQRAETWGIELSGIWQATPWWRLRGGYTYLRKALWATSPGVIPGSDTVESIDPRNQFLLHSSLDLPGQVQFDTVMRYVDVLPVAPAPSVPAYFTFDVRLAWQYENWELSVVGQNLWDNRHPEFGGLEIPRSVYGKATWRF
jgi:iron complex outermembrane receptor protein